jgi:Preprotein translocase subunit SecB
MIETQTKLQFKGIDIPIVDFKSVKPISGRHEISVEVVPKVFFSEDSETEFKVVQNVHVFVEDAFELTVAAIGSFKLSGTPEEPVRTNLISVNAPAIMFPYIRAFIATLTANLGGVIGTLNIPPQFFGALIVSEDAVEDTTNGKL